MERRNILKVGALLLVLPAGRLLTACGGGDGGPSQQGGGGGGGGGGGADAGTSEPLTVTSSNVNGHTHRFTIEGAELSAPPTSGISRSTSIDMGHVHTVELSAEELDAIDGGDTVTKETSLANGHTHQFQFRRA